MSHSFPNFYSKPDSFRRLLWRLVSSNHNHEDIIEDDWEFIEFLDRELSDEEDVDMVTETQSVSSLGHASSIKPIKLKYIILTRADIRRHLEDKITKVSEVLLLTRNEAAILLQHFKWDVNRTNDEWIACEEKVRNAVGLFLRPVVETPADAVDEIACSLCHVDFSRDLMHSASCGHQICRSCWEGYIREAIDDGPGCLTFRCPETSCDAAVGLCMIELLTPEYYKKKFETRLLRSFFTCSKKAKWCPAPDCDNAVLSLTGEEDTVTCQCLHSFCWNCLMEAHAPVDCATAKEWMSEGSRHSENWVYANTMPCPNCKYKYEIPEARYPTYANCTICNYQFCWACGDDWYNKKDCAAMHSCICNSDGGHKLLIKRNIERYSRYYEGWALCESARANALEDLKLFQEMQLNLSCVALGEIAFVAEALKQVVECWQLLKWTHVYGYFPILPDGDLAKRNLFEFIQGDATGLVKKLEKYLDEFQGLLYEDAEFGQFVEFQNRITTLTRVLRRYFDHLEVGLRAGLKEVGLPSLTMSQEEGENSCKREKPDVSPNLTRYQKS